MMPELIEYRVIGTIEGYRVEYCGLPQRDSETVTEKVDYVIEAKDETEAKWLAEVQYEEIGENNHFSQWLNLLILLPGEKPSRPLEVELVLLDRWNKGLGLPAEPVIA